MIEGNREQKQPDTLQKIRSWREASAVGNLTPGEIYSQKLEMIHCSQCKLKYHWRFNLLSYTRHVKASIDRVNFPSYICRTGYAALSDLGLGINMKSFSWKTKTSTME